VCSMLKLLIMTIKEGCLDQMIFFGEDSLRDAIREFVTHYHFERNHQGLNNRLIISSNGQPVKTGPVRKRRRLGGMLNHYYREAA
jgi:putative transposase